MASDNYEARDQSVCGVELVDHTGRTRTCIRSAQRRPIPHIHRDRQIWFVGCWGRVRCWTYYQPLRKRCPECGKKKTDVTTGLDPFDQDINGRAVPMTACNDCFIRRTEDI